METSQLGKRTWDQKLLLVTYTQNTSSYGQGSSVHPCPTPGSLLALAFLKAPIRIDLKAFHSPPNSHPKDFETTPRACDLGATTISIYNLTCNPFSSSTSWDLPPLRPLFTCSKHLGLLWGLCMSTPFQTGLLAHCLTFFNPLLRYSLPSEACLVTLSELISYGSPQLAPHVTLLLHTVLITIWYSFCVCIYIYFSFNKMHAYEFSLRLCTVKSYHQY